MTKDVAASVSDLTSVMQPATSAGPSLALTSRMSSDRRFKDEIYSQRFKTISLFCFASDDSDYILKY
jgi:hypothetical protein